MAGRKRIQRKSIDERIVSKIKEIHECTTAEAYRVLKHKRFTKAMASCT